MFKIKVICFLTAILIAISCNKKSDLADKATRNFMDYYIHQYLKRDSIILLNEFFNINNSTCFAEVIRTQNNIKFKSFEINEQKWTKSSIEKVRLISLNETPRLNKLNWKVFKKKVGNDFFIFSKPIFSIDYQYVLINTSYYCDDRCGYHKLQLFKKDNQNNWILLRNYCEADN